MAHAWFKTSEGARKRALFESTHSPNGVSPAKPHTVERLADGRYLVRPYTKPELLTRFMAGQRT